MISDPHEAATEMDPNLLEAVHGVEDRKKLAKLVDDMSRNGWVGRPLLMVNGSLWTGSHRVAAAREAGLELVPVLAVEIDQDEIEAFGPVTDDDDRLHLLELVFGVDDNPAALLFNEEIAHNLAGGAL